MLGSNAPVNGLQEVQLLDQLVRLRWVVPGLAFVVH
jgi:hypothetical protein